MMDFGESANVPGFTMSNAPTAMSLSPSSARRGPSFMNVEHLHVLLEGSTPDGVDCTTASLEYGSGQAIEVETGLFLYALTRRLRPLVALETGTHWGYSGSWIAAALSDGWRSYPDSRKPILYSIDCNAYENKAEKLWDRLGVRDLISRYVISSLDFVPPQPPEFIWFDADHAEDFVITEWQKIVPHASKQQVVIGFHDTRLDVQEGRAIDRIIAERISPIGDYAFVQRMALRNFRGLDLIQLKN